MIDVIGDVHGHLEALEALLRKLGYRLRAGAWRHTTTDRRALFVGDLIDRGPQIRETVATVRDMVEAGSALVVLGNHELNAVMWATRRDDGSFLRTHTPGRRAQHAASLEAWGGTIPADVIGWMATLPLTVEVEGMRAAHAAWSEELVAAAGPTIDLTALGERGSPHRVAVEAITKGLEVPLPAGSKYRDKEGTVRWESRVRWWIAHYDLPEDVSLETIAMPPADTALAGRSVPRSTLPRAAFPGYRASEPLFIGHYWLSGAPAPFTERIACLDYSVANGGALCSYLWDGEVPLTRERFTCVRPRPMTP